MRNPNYVAILMIFLVVIMFSVLMVVAWIIATSDFPPWFKFSLLS